MTRTGITIAIGGVAAALVLPVGASAQVVRSFTPPSRDTDQKSEIPREYRPPRGMCRIWIDSVPPRQQPAPTDCATAVRNKPRNGRVIWGEDAKGSDKKDEKRKKPEDDTGTP
ncbi:MAG: hypothetical protein IT361_06990 [Gemmatimonadaceae bacterium]|nr:hypothetical protein [Gemmatimonadaceae bacterium]